MLFANHTHIAFNRKAIVVDVAEFEGAVALAGSALHTKEHGENLARAVGLYAGDLLPGSYEEWALWERERLSVLFGQTLLQLAEHAGEMGDTQQAVDHAWRAARRDPYNEAAHYAAVRWLMASGQARRAGALYQEFETRLKTEVQGVPSAQMRALAERLRGENTCVVPLSVAPFPTRPAAPGVPAGPDAESTLRARNFRPHLPLTLTRFFGREAELHQADLIFASARLLTLTGLGGCGKTRLAIEIARGQATAFDTVVFVALADTNHPTDILTTIADTLITALHPSESAPTQPADCGQDALALIETLLSMRHTLLILDNFEHLTAGARIVPALLEKCPHLACLVTSRSPLQISGERLLAVAPFTHPDEALTPAQLQMHPSIRLFVDRAQAMRSDFRLTAQNARVLAGLCADLDGLPLALELAAARVGTFTLSAMRRQLTSGKERFQLLVARHGGAQHRHHRLTATLEWSYHQLSPVHRSFFSCLSLLHGPWTIHAAHAVGGLGDLEETRNALEEMCLASLTVSATSEEEHGGPSETRFHLLETLRQFGRQQLSSQETNEAATRHAQYCLRQTEVFSSGEEEGEGSWIALMEQSMPNVRAALGWSFSPDGNALLGMRLCIVLTGFWHHRNHFTEALRFFTLALASEAGNQEIALKADLLHGAALFASLLNRYVDAAAWERESLRLQRESGDLLKVASCLQNIAHYVWCLSDLEASEGYHKEALALWEQLNDTEGIGRAYGGLGEIALNRGDVDGAACWQSRRLVLARQSGSELSIAAALGGLCDLMATQEQWTRAKILAGEALAMRLTHGDEFQIAYGRMRVVRACRGLGEWNEAETHLQAMVPTLERLADRSGLAGAHRQWVEVTWKQDRPDLARTHLQQCFTFLLQLNQPASMAKAAEEWIVLTFDCTVPLHFIPLLAALATLYPEISVGRSSAEKRGLESCLASARAHGDQTDFDRAWQQGQSMPWQELLGQLLTL